MHLHRLSPTVCPSSSKFPLIFYTNKHYKNPSLSHISWQFISEGRDEFHDSRGNTQMQLQLFYNVRKSNVYLVLNLCRALPLKRDHIRSSKLSCLSHVSQCLRDHHHSSCILENNILLLIIPEIFLSSKAWLGTENLQYCVLQKGAK